MSPFWKLETQRNNIYENGRKINFDPRFLPIRKSIVYNNRLNNRCHNMTGPRHRFFFPVFFKVLSKSVESLFETSFNFFIRSE